MRLVHLHAQRYLSLQDVSLDVDSLNVFIGANAAGKSNILNALRFLSDGVVAGDFEKPVADRGGIIHLAWKGEEANDVRLQARFEDGTRAFEWRLRLWRDLYSFDVDEEVWDVTPDQAKQLLLQNKSSKGWWFSDCAKKEIPIDLSATACA